jgi:hypothetical protein
MNIQIKRIKVELLVTYGVTIEYLDEETIHITIYENPVFPIIEDKFEIKKMVVSYINNKNLYNNKWTYKNKIENSRKDAQIFYDWIKEFHNINEFCVPFSEKSDPLYFWQRFFSLIKNDTLFNILKLSLINNAGELCRMIHAWNHIKVKCLCIHYSSGMIGDLFTVLKFLHTNKYIKIIKIYRGYNDRIKEELEFCEPCVNYESIKMEVMEFSKNPFLQKIEFISDEKTSSCELIEKSVENNRKRLEANLSLLLNARDLDEKSLVYEYYFPLDLLKTIIPLTDLELIDLSMDCKKLQIN